MATTDEVNSWFGPTLLDMAPEPDSDTSPETQRLWRGFMAARTTLGLVLVLVHGALYALELVDQAWLLAVCCAYAALTMATRVGLRPQRLRRSFDGPWVAVIGIDVAVFALLQWLHGSSINYTPLFALPVLLASVLGSLLLAMGTAAGVTLLLLLNGLRLSMQTHDNMAPLFIQIALTGAGSFVIAYLSHQLATRLASQERQTRRSQTAARIQQQVNDLVIESLQDGVLVVDGQGTVHAANPAARLMLKSEWLSALTVPFRLTEDTAWQPLLALTQQSFAVAAQHYADINIQLPGQGARHIRARTQLTGVRQPAAGPLCVVFLQDQREIEARIRTDKLASMGRLSAAVAHEIRNPLAAISQANALLDEELTTPGQRQLTGLVHQNAQRLARIVDDILDIARVKGSSQAEAGETLALEPSVRRICRDWEQAQAGRPTLHLDLNAPNALVDFEQDHLRRVLVNLLDNAHRHASAQAGSIQVITHSLASNQTALTIWSDGEPLDASVQQHLFEPFFSSQSRSSGLGLYISRELCERHGATLSYQRTQRKAHGALCAGNAFVLHLRPPPAVRDTVRDLSLQPTPRP